LKRSLKSIQCSFANFRVSWIYESAMFLGYASKKLLYKSDFIMTLMIFMMQNFALTYSASIL